MRPQQVYGVLAASILLVGMVAACGSPATGGTASSTAAPIVATAAGSLEEATAPAATSAPAASGAKDAVTLQLKWVAQGQFAGYYAAKEKGFYDAENLDVTIRPGGPDINPVQVVDGGQAQFGIDWLPSTLANRESGAKIVNIAQVFQRSGMREISWKDSNITTPNDLKGKKVAVWLGGNELQLFATLAKYNINKDSDVTIVKQPFDMNLLLNKEVDAAAAMTYNEYYQVLAAGHKPEELNIIDFNTEGTAMLEDGIFTTESFLADAKNKDIAARFLRASLKGWEYCRDNTTDCVKFILAQDATGVMQEDAQKWQIEEINKLIFPLPECATSLGYMCPDAYKQTVEIAKKYGVIKNDPDEGAYTHEIWEMTK